MRRFVIAAGMVLAFAVMAAAGPHGRGGGGHFGGGGFSGHRGFGGHFHGGHSHGFFGGGFFFDPLLYPYYPYYAYPYPYYAPYPPPDDYPPDDEVYGEPPGDEGSGPRAEAEPPSREDAERASYGLVQLRGVPDGAAVDLDGRFWLTAQALDERWLAVPFGDHTVAVHVRGSEPVEQRFEVRPGKTNVVRFGPFGRRSG